MFQIQQIITLLVHMLFKFSKNNLLQLEAHKCLKQCRRFSEDICISVSTLYQKYISSALGHYFYFSSDQKYRCSKNVLLLQFLRDLGDSKESYDSKAYNKCFKFSRLILCLFILWYETVLSIVVRSIRCSIKST